MSDAVVMGVPDDEWGELVAAVVATTGDEPPDAAALDEWVGARLAGYKRPRRIVFADEVGRTTVGKLDYEWARRGCALSRSTRCSPGEVLAHEVGRTRAVSSCTKKCVPATVTRSTPARSACAGEHAAGQVGPVGSTRW